MCRHRLIDHVDCGVGILRAWNRTMRLLIGLPMMRATMPRWSAFSRLWLSGYTCPRADSRCVAPAAKQNMASGPGAAAAHHLAVSLQRVVEVRA
jgi:hypothetical protein